MNYTSDRSPAYISLSRTEVIMMLATIIMEGKYVSDVHRARLILCEVFGGRKIVFIKFVRTYARMSLVEAKDFVELHVFTNDPNFTYEERCILRSAQERYAQ